MKLKREEACGCAFGQDTIADSRMEIPEQCSGISVILLFNGSGDIVFYLFYV